MKPGLLKPEATTSWSTRPNFCSAASSIAWASARLSGRRTITAGSPPSSRTSATTSSSSSLLPDASSTLPPSAVSASAVARPNVPEAPVTMATLPLTSNSDSGLRSGSEIMVRLPPGFETKRLLRIEHGDHAQRAALALRPTPRKREERAAAAGDGVDIAADILDAGNAVGHHDLVCRLPIRKIFDDVMAGLRLVLDVEMRLRRARSMRTEERAERMIERLHVDADKFYAALHQPFRGFLVEPGRIGEVIGIVAVVPVASRVDHHDVVLLDLWLGAFQILRRDDAPLAFRDRNDNAGAEEAPQRIPGQSRRVLRHMDRRIHMGAAMHDAFELLHQKAVLGVKLHDPNIEIGARRPLRHAVAPGMAKVEELQTVGATRRFLYRRCCLRPRCLAPGATLQPARALGIEQGDQPNHASVALMPFPRKALERAALAAERIKIAADILDGRNPGF